MNSLGFNYTFLLIMLSGRIWYISSLIIRVGLAGIIPFLEAGIMLIVREGIFILTRQFTQQPNNLVLKMCAQIDLESKCRLLNNNVCDQTVFQSNCKSRSSIESDSKYALVKLLPATILSSC